MIKSINLNTTTFEIFVPQVPNFLKSAEPEDVAQPRMFSLQHFSDSQLKRVGEAWTNNLIETARQRRNLPKL